MVYKENIRELRRVDRELADKISNAGQSADIIVSESKSGMPTLRVNNIYIHSSYDPVKEAAAWVKSYEQKICSADHIVVFGFGLGYHIVELFRSSGMHITVFEPNIIILKAALQRADLEPVLSKIKIITDDSVPYFEGNTAALTHKPSLNLAPEYFNRVLSKLKARDILSKGLRVMVVGPVYGGSLEVARYCSSSLINLGHTVELVDNSRFDDMLFYIKKITRNKDHYNALVDQFTHLLSEFVIARCEEFKPDIVFALAQAPLTPESMNRIRQYGVKTAYWFVEDFRFMEYWKQIASSCDHFFTIQKDDFFNELQQSGLHNYHYLPMAAFPAVHKSLEMTEEEIKYYGSDVSFVGAGYYNRRHFFGGLIDYDLKIWGTDWDMRTKLANFIQRSGSRVDTDEIVKIYNASRININLHSSTYHKGVNPFGDFVNPRTFEIMSCGGFQLVDRRSELNNLFKEGEEVVIFDDQNDLRQKIEYYLKNPDEAHIISENGRNRVLRDHTYEKRMEEMLEVLVAQGYEPATWGDDRELLRDLITEAGEETGVGGYLSQFDKHERINLSDIIEKIAGDEGELSKEEALFMMMKEFTG